MAKRTIVKGEGETRRRILRAAARRFANGSYDDVSLRQIAADVAVDVAYVHRSFGSKEALFREVLAAFDNEVASFAMDDARLGAVLAERLFERPHDAAFGDADPLQMLIRSLHSPKAGAITSARLQAGFVEPLQARLGDGSPFRATMIISLLIGLSTMRNLLRLPGAREVEVGEAQAMLADAITDMIRSSGRRRKD